MFKINISWAPQMYREYENSKKEIVRTAIGECRTHHLLRITVKGLRSHLAKDVLSYIAHHIDERCDTVMEYGDKKLLSSMKWGVSATYDETTRSYVDCICIPKDFDNVASHKKAVMAVVRSIARDAKYELVEYSKDVENDHFSYEVEM